MLIVSQTASVAGVERRRSFKFSARARAPLATPPQSTTLMERRRQRFAVQGTTASSLLNVLRIGTAALTHFYRHFPYTNIVSTVNGSNKTAEFFGCTSIYPASAGVTSVFVECSSCGFRSELDGTTTHFTSVSGPVTMWAQPITVAFQKSDLSLFTTSSAQVTGVKTGVKTTTSHSITTPTSTGGSPNSSANSTSQSTGPAPTSPASGLSNGTIAGIAIGAAALLGLLIGGAILFKRRQKSASSSSAARDTQSTQQDPMQGTYGSTHHPKQNHVYAEGEVKYDAMGQRLPNEGFKSELHHDHLLELSNHADRRYELGS